MKERGDPADGSPLVAEMVLRESSTQALSKINGFMFARGASNATKACLGIGGCRVQCVINALILPIPAIASTLDSAIQSPKPNLITRAYI